MRPADQDRERARNGLPGRQPSSSTSIPGQSGPQPGGGFLVIPDAVVLAWRDGRLSDGAYRTYQAVVFYRQLKGPNLARVSDRELAKWHLDRHNLRRYFAELERVVPDWFRVVSRLRGRGGSMYLVPLPQAQKRLAQAGTAAGGVESAPADVGNGAPRDTISLSGVGNGAPTDAPFTSAMEGEMVRQLTHRFGASADAPKEKKGVNPPQTPPCQGGGRAPADAGGAGEADATLAPLASHPAKRGPRRSGGDARSARVASGAPGLGSAHCGPSRPEPVKAEPAPPAPSAALTGGRSGTTDPQAGPGALQAAEPGGAVLGTVLARLMAAQAERRARLDGGGGEET